MKLNQYPDIHDKLAISGTAVSVDGIRDDRYNTSGRPKTYTVMCSDTDNKRYQFIVFSDLTVSKVHKVVS